jgi:hypothetical protein
MGRGLGGVQRRVVDTLAARSPSGRPRWTISEITAAIYGADHTDSQRRGVSRAVSTLAARHLVDTSLTARRFRKVNNWRRESVEPYIDTDGQVHSTVYTRRGRVPVPEVDVYLYPLPRVSHEEAVALDEALHRAFGSKPV